MSLEIVQSRNVLEMITVANEFCIFTESLEKHPLENLLHYYQRITPLLYLKGMLLPNLSVEDPSFSERFVNEEQWEAIYKMCKEKFGDKDQFFQTDFEDSTIESLQKGSIAECIADVYQDMKDVILLYQKNILAAKENAVHDCRQLFLQHWGLRCLEISRALHHITLSQQILTDEAQ